MEPGKDRYRLLMEHLPDAFAYHQIVTDYSGNPVDYIILDVNPAFSAMTGFSREQVIGKKVAEVLPGFKKSSFDWVNPFGKVALTGESICFEQYLEPLDRWYEIIAASGDEPGYFSVFFRDVTETKETEQKLANFKASLESSKDAVGMSTPQGRHYYQNKAFSELFGNVGENPADSLFVNKKTGEEVFRTIMSGEEWEGEVKMYAKDGQVLDILLQAFPNKDDNGNITGLVGIHTDITKRKRAENELQKSEEKYRLLAENASDVIWTADLDLNYTYISPSAEHISGYTVEEIMSMGAHDILTPSSLEQAFRVIQSELELEASGKADPNRTQTVELEQYRKDGSTVWVEIKASILRDQEGRPNGILGITRDITERKQAEEKLKEEHFLRMNLLDNIPGCIALILKKETREIVASNKAAQEIGAVPGEKCYETCASRKDECPFCLAPVLWATGEQKEKEVNYQGTWYHGIWAPLSEDLYVHYIFDITERKLAEEALQQAHFRLTTVVDSMDALVYIADMDTYEILFINEYGRRIHGNIAGQICWKAIQGQDEPCWFCTNDKLIDKDGNPTGVYAWEYQNILNGRWYDCRDRAVLWHEGRIVKMEIATDVTERKEAEQKLADYTQELEQLYRYLDQEISKAQQVHEQILPQSLPAIESISITAYYQPAEEMGGDFYDLIHRGNKLICYLSDVSGHGMDGAMLSLFVKHTINSYIDLTPAETIEPKPVLNYLAEKYYQETFPEELFIAIFLAVLDLDSMDLAYCGAGFQEKPLVRLGTGEQLELVSRGFVISRLFPVDALNFNEASVKLSPGSTLFFTTDGLTEQGRNGTHFMDRLPDVFYANAHLPPELIKQAVVEDFRRFNNGSLQGKDDITFLVIKVEE